MVSDTLGTAYVRVSDRSMGQIKMAAYIHRRHAHAVSHVESSFVATGVLRIGVSDPINHDIS